MSIAKPMTRIESNKRSGRWLRWLLLTPFRIGWWFATRVEKATGIAFTLVAGAILVVAGFWLSSTILGLILGIPMIVAGGFLLARALY